MELKSSSKGSKPSCPENDAEMEDLLEGLVDEYGDSVDQDGGSPTKVIVESP